MALQLFSAHLTFLHWLSLFRSELPVKESENCLCFLFVCLLKRANGLLLADLAAQYVSYSICPSTDLYFDSRTTAAWRFCQLNVILQTGAVTREKAPRSA